VRRARFPSRDGEAFARGFLPCEVCELAREGSRAAGSQGRRAERRHETIVARSHNVSFFLFSCTEELRVKEITCLLFSLIDYGNLLGDAIKFGEMRKKRIDVKFGPNTDREGRYQVWWDEKEESRRKFGLFTQIERYSLHP
jgi:hypothetical protein